MTDHPRGFVKYKFNSMQYTNFNAGTPNLPSLSLFEESLRVRLEEFALDAQIPLDHYLKADLETVQEQIELQMHQLRFLLNEIRLLEMLKHS